MTLLIVYIGLTLGTSFSCSVLEAVLLSLTPAYIARTVSERPKVGETLRALKADIDRPLAAILSLNTIANTAGAVGVGAQAQFLWGSHVLAVASAALTLAVLIIAEIIPKTLGAVYWRKLAPVAAGVLPVMVVLLTPLVALSQVITRLVKSRKGKETVSREEIAALARLGEEQGVVDATELRTLNNLLRLGNLTVRDIMTPRTVVFSLPATTTVADAIERGPAMVFSRIPVWRENSDDVIGYILKDELLLRAARGELDRPIGELARDALIVPDFVSEPTLFERLLDKREHIAMVVDEYGGLAGVVTMEDVVETLLGLEIVDEVDAVYDMREMARAQWRARRKHFSSPPPPAPADPEEGPGGEPKG